MIVELGNVSVETKGPPFVANHELYQGQSTRWEDL
jgi:hypothetical protein